MGDVHANTSFMSRSGSLNVFFPEQLFLCDKSRLSCHSRAFSHSYCTNTIPQSNSTCKRLQLHRWTQLPQPIVRV